ncbi:hypothetical protein HDU98_005555 [Podochytrium sp. JEL0797]|nr:hypothetical protein HDU98_005555 [Podochytrium sp. JEL0797]
MSASSFTTTNSAITDPTLWDVESQVLELLISGMAIDTMFKGLVKAVSQCVKRKDGRFVPIVVGLYNIFKMGSILVFYMDFTLHPSVDQCRVSALAGIILFHASMLMFGILILFRTWIVTSNNSYFLAFGVLAILNRGAWGIYDLATLSSAPSLGNCVLWSQKTPQFGYLISITFIDVVCTITTAAISVQYFKSSDLKNLFAVLVVENLIRTTCVLVMQSILMYTTLADVDVNWVNLVGAVQVYVFAQVVNSEFWWVRVRRRVLPVEFKDVGEEMRQNEVN